MHRSYFALILVSVGSVALLLVTSLPGVAASFSGRVVDENGKPIAGISVVLLPKFAETDETGAFSLTDITPLSVSHLMLSPEDRAEYEVRAIEIEGMIFYLDWHHYHWHDGGFPIALESGAAVKDVEITVKLRMRIRGRVVSADGTPLRDAKVHFEIKWEGDGRRGRASNARTLDADGYFVEYVAEPAHYTITVGDQERSAESEKISLEAGQRFDDLILRLSSPSEPLPPREVAKPVFKTEMLASTTPPVKPQAVIPPRGYDPQSAEAARQREREGMWAINPDNRHAYKVIHCETREAAAAKAAAQGAHLVAINDAAEQYWLLEVFGKKRLLKDETEQRWDFKAFGRESLWIGLSDETKEGKPHWDNGEPVTYTNWGSPQKLIDADDSTKNRGESKYYTVFVGRTGKWQMVRQGGFVAGLIKKAILEKEHFILGTSEPTGTRQTP